MPTDFPAAAIIAATSSGKRYSSANWHFSVVPEEHCAFVVSGPFSATCYFNNLSNHVSPYSAQNSYYRDSIATIG
jgi:hypothetical protein